MSNSSNDHVENKKKKKSRIRSLTVRMERKLAWLFIIAVGALFLLVGRLIYINRQNGAKYEEIVMSQQSYTNKAIPFKRGEITDRNGTILATSIKVYNVVIDPKIITTEQDGKYVEPTINALARCFPQIPEEEIRKIINENEESRYIVDDRLKKLTFEEIEKMEKMMSDDDNIQGVWFEEEYKRVYPYNSLASATIGFSASGNVGVTGIEQYYNDYLNGTDGRRYGYVNEDNAMEGVVREATDGYNLVSTIDVKLQMICEKYIAQWEEEYHPKRVAVILANPNTGEILAMADSESIFDLNNPYDLSSYYTQEEIDAMSDEEKMNNNNKMWRNFCVSDTFEAGSTIKPFTVAGALEEGKITTDMTFLCDGAEIYSRAIHCHKRSGHGTLDVEQAIMNSCNDALMQISRLEGIETFCKYQSLFGFGMRSGIDLPGEASCEGLLYTVDNMTMEALATNSFGQNFNVNTMQMIAGFSALINGGNYYKPHVIKQIVNEKGGVVQSFDKQLIKQTVTKDTSDFLRHALYNTVAAGTGKTAAVNGYKVGGKTGTAQHHDKTDNTYLLSFLGFAPYEKPQVVCYAIVDSPDVEDSGSSAYAGRLFSAVMTEVLPYMNIFPDTEISTEGNQNTDTQNTDTQNTDTQNTDTQNTDTQNTDTQNTDAQNTDAQNTDAQNTDAQNTDVQNEDGQNTENDNRSEGQDEQNPSENQDHTDDSDGDETNTEYSPSEDENYEPDQPAIDQEDVDELMGNDNSGDDDSGNETSED